MDQRDAKVYQFDPQKKRKLMAVNYISPEKKQLLRDRKKAHIDKRNFYIGAAALLSVIAAITMIKLYLM